MLPWRPRRPLLPHALLLIIRPTRPPHTVNDAVIAANVATEAEIEILSRSTRRVVRLVNDVGESTGAIPPILILPLTPNPPGKKEIKTILLYYSFISA